MKWSCCKILKIENPFTDQADLVQGSPLNILQGVLSLTRIYIYIYINK